MAQAFVAPGPGLREAATQYGTARTHQSQRRPRVVCNERGNPLDSGNDSQNLPHALRSGRFLPTFLHRHLSEVRAGKDPGDDEGASGKQAQPPRPWLPEWIRKKEQNETNGEKDPDDVDASGVDNRDGAIADGPDGDRGSVISENSPERGERTGNIVMESGTGLNPWGRSPTEREKGARVEPGGGAGGKNEAETGADTEAWKRAAKGTSDKEVVGGKQGATVSPNAKGAPGAEGTSETDAGTEAEPNTNRGEEPKPSEGFRIFGGLLGNRSRADESSPDNEASGHQRSNKKPRANGDTGEASGNKGPDKRVPRWFMQGPREDSTKDSDTPAEVGARKESSVLDGPIAVGKQAWNRMLDVFVPNRNRPGEQRLESPKQDKQITDKQQNISTQEVASKSNPELTTQSEKQDENRNTGVNELYRPPPSTQASDEDKRTGIFGGLVDAIGRMWKRSENTESQASGQRDGEANSEDSNAERPRSAKTGAQGPKVPSKREASSESDDSGHVGEEPAGKSSRKAGTSKPSVDEKSSQGKVIRRSRGRIITSTLGSSVDISTVPQKDVAAIRMIFGSETFFATETLSPPGGLIFRGNLRGEPTATLAKLEKRLSDRLGDKYTLCLAEGEEDLRPVVVVVPTARDRRPPSARQRFFSIVIGILTAATCIGSALFANWRSLNWKAEYTPRGWMVMVEGYSTMSELVRFLLLRKPVVLMALAVLLIMLLSQFVQRLVARRYHTRLGLPYFVPSFQLGSFGPIVQVASPAPTRAALFDIALSGAATLALVSLFLLVIGIRLTPSYQMVVPVPVSALSDSLLVGTLTKLLGGGGQLLVSNAVAATGSAAASAASVQVVQMHPMAVVGANCLRIAALNLLPVRQLDGGRIVSAIYGRKTAILVSRVTICFLLVSASKSNHFLLFLAVVVFGPWSLDRPAKNELTEPSNLRAIVGYLFLLLMVGVLLPYPSHVPFKLS